jgi:hypothetical protein
MVEVEVQEEREVYVEDVIQIHVQMEDLVTVKAEVEVEVKREVKRLEESLSLLFERKMNTPEAQVIEAMFHISTKEGKRVPFMLNPSQVAYDDVRTKRDIIAKCRQKGFSSLGIGYQSVDCLGKEGTRAVLISHEATATQRLLDKARYYFQHIEGPKPELGRHSRNEFFFPKTESTYYIGTAGARAFGRGDTITHLHISEYAWWEAEALRHVAGLFQAVPASGTIRIESTGNGRGNDFYYLTRHAEKLGYNVFFRAWWEDSEYERDVPEGGFIAEGHEDYFEELEAFLGEQRLGNESIKRKLYWYWNKLLEFRSDVRTMQQEYPTHLKECFQATGGAIFINYTQTKTSLWSWGMKHGYRMEFLKGHPKPDHQYVIGCDASGGTGHDEAAIQIGCLETMEQVLEFASNTIDPVELGHLLVKIGKEYNDSWLVPESNNHGIAVLSVVKKDYPLSKIYKRKIPLKSGKPVYGWFTSKTTKPELVGAIKECAEMGMTLYGHQTTKELEEFEEDERGEMSADQDGLVISLGLLSVGYQKYRRFAHKLEAPPPPPPRPNLDKNYMYYTFEEVMGNIKDRVVPTQYPFEDQIERIGRGDALL